MNNIIKKDMENKINIAKILKDCPKGMKLDCTIYTEVTLIGVDDREDIVYPIKVSREDGNFVVLTKYGQYRDSNFAKCVIFPKGKTTWEGFQRPFKDGDVVVAEDSESFQIFLLKHLTHSEDDNNYDGYCYFGWDFQCNELFEKGNWGFNRHATEEEKARLFNAIKDNGYKWNEETKTLDKLVEPKFKVGDRITPKDFKGKSRIINAILDSKYNLYGGGTIPFDDQNNWKLDKFDITILKPFDNVLVRDKDIDTWEAHLFSRYYKSSDRPYICIGGEGLNEYKQCIPYDSNKELLGTTDDCDEFYKTWE